LGRKFGWGWGSGQENGPQSSELLGKSVSSLYSSDVHGKSIMQFHEQVIFTFNKQLTTIPVTHGCKFSQRKEGTKEYRMIVLHGTATESDVVRKKKAEIDVNILRRRIL